MLGLGFLAASLLAHRAWRRSRRVGQLLLAAGLLIAAFSQVHTAVHPGSYAGLVTTGDLLRLAFSIVLLVGFVIDSRDDLRALRFANLELRRLRDAELARPFDRRSRSGRGLRARSTTGWRRICGTRSSSRAASPRPPDSPANCWL
ncbi:MAG: hypothetical protein ACR2K4_03220 [Candidatus Limnocylindria bacterium]